jgi:hypothetical protein
MISYIDSVVTQLTVHKAGNKVLNESPVLSEQPLSLSDPILEELLKQYFLKPFEKVNEIYRLYHPTGDSNLNEVFHFATAIFNSPETFHENTKHIATHLYDISNHPKIKSGELYFAYFKNLPLEGEQTDVLGIFKSENKEPYITVLQQHKGFNIHYQEEAINIKKLDKGCLIFNSEKEKGYKVAVIDQTNKTEAVYWIDDFLKLKIRNDNFNQTQNTLNVYKSFVTEKMDEVFDISNADKIDLLNRSIKYFKDKDSFDLDEFSNVVIANEQGIEMFKSYKKDYEETFESPIADNFSISDAAVKKQSRIFRKVLKLDKNFHIYIHGNNELIEKGYDAAKNMNYYKVYFTDEQ